MSHNVFELVSIFDSCFKHSESTLLIPGSTEPLYLPADTYCPYHRIFSTQDFFSSALHEISHWCIAGCARRLQVDYGYWYNPDGRTVQQQVAFESVEVCPQALECIFSFAAGIRFNVSVDNLSSTMSAELYQQLEQQFAARVNRQVEVYLDQGLPERATVFLNALLAMYQQEHAINWKNCHVS